MEYKNKLSKSMFEMRPWYLKVIYSIIIFFALMLNSHCSFMFVSQQEIDDYDACGKCFECCGSGRVVCPLCHGRGKISCSDCSGSGKKTGVSITDIDPMNYCLNCLGSGDNNCPKCKNFYQIDCERCNGTGKAPKKEL